jgi:hypothetical protein
VQWETLAFLDKLSCTPSFDHLALRGRLLEVVIAESSCVTDQYMSTCKSRVDSVQS